MKTKTLAYPVAPVELTATAHGWTYRVCVVGDPLPLPDGDVLPTGTRVLLLQGPHTVVQELTACGWWWRGFN